MAMLFAKEWSISLFEVLQQDIDDFILLAKYFMALNNNKAEKEVAPAKVNDGFWDF